MQVVDVVPEVQSVSLGGSTGDTVYLSFLEQNTTVVIGTDTAATIQASLEGLVTVSAYPVAETSPLFDYFVVGNASIEPGFIMRYWLICRSALGKLTPNCHKCCPHYKSCRSQQGDEVIVQRIPRVQIMLVSVGMKYVEQEHT